MNKRDRKLIEGSIEDFSTVIHFKPKFISAYINRAISYCLLENTTKAKRDFDGARKIDPTDEVLLHNYRVFELQMKHGAQPDILDCYQDDLRTKGMYR